MDHESNAIWLDRTLFTAMQYPADYGFFPDTLAEDGDPLDALVLLAEPTFPGCHVHVRPVAVFWMSDEKGPTRRCCAWPRTTRAGTTSRTSPTSTDHLLDEIEHFFEFYKTIEPGKDTTTRGWEGAREAEAAIVLAKAAYR